jgi:hypothetical protein
MKLFYDDECDALAQTISNSEKTFKSCAAFLFPHLKPESQYARLKNCLNPAKDDEFLKFGQIIALCKFCDNYDALHFMADELNHERPARRQPEDELGELIREYLKTKAQGAKLEPRIEERIAKLRAA